MKETKQAVEAQDGEARIMNIRVGDLSPHPDAQTYGDSRSQSDEVEDLIALTGDIEKYGVLSPLDVVASGEKGKWLVIDGCRRLKSSQALKLASVPCVDRGIVPDVRGYAVSKNAMRRKLSGGERIMRFIDLHQREVADAWKAGAEQAEGNGKMGGKHTPTSREVGVSMRSIAERLGCSKMDALAGMQIAACVEFGLKPERDPAYGKLMLVPAVSEVEKAAVTAAKAAVLAGTAGIRRWPAAYAGKVAVGKAGGRAETDYAAIAERSSISLTNAFIHWGEADWKGSVSRKKVELQLAKMLDAMVACHGADFFVRAIKGRWPDHMAEALSKGIKP